jgi:glyoxylase-like metal-dependent hydrolase (beta-lactamase superfamily II)
MLKVKVLKSGYCKQILKLTNRNKKLKIVKFFTSFGLIKIDNTNEYILFDTGYSKLFYKETTHFPNKIYSLVTKVYCQDKDEVIYKLKTLGISVNEIKYIVLSHFHADHIAGCRFFKNAQFICDKNAYISLKCKNKFLQVREGFISSLLPDDFEKRVLFVQDIKSKTVDLYGFNAKQIINRDDLFVFSIEGHAKGQIGLYVKADKEYLFVADAVWSHEAYRNLNYPHWIAFLIIDNKREYISNILKLNKIYKNKNLKIICTHDGR